MVAKTYTIHLKGDDITWMDNQGKNKSEAIHLLIQLARGCYGDKNLPAAVDHERIEIMNAIMSKQDIRQILQQVSSSDSHLNNYDEDGLKNQQSSNEPNKTDFKHLKNSNSSNDETNNNHKEPHGEATSLSKNDLKFFNS